MKEILRRFAAHPFIAGELIVASFFANLLALASPLFVIQVLNRYVAYGVDATLATLTAGVVLAIFLETGFRQARLMLANQILEQRDEERAVGAFGTIVSAKMGSLEQIPADQRREILRGLDTVSTNYNAPNIAAVLDVPFALVFVAALMLLNPILGGIATAFIIGAFVFSILHQRLLAGIMQMLSHVSGLGNALVTSTDRAADTVRAFNGHDMIMKAWRGYVERIQDLRQQVNRRQGAAQTITQNLQALMSVAIIAVGAILVVQGELDAGTMIGANILAARGLGPVLRLAQLTQGLAKGAQALASIRLLANMPVEPDEGTALETYRGNLEFRDVAFGFPGQAAPLFETLDLNLAPGSVLLVQGRNGAGKSTLARLVAGLLEPARGSILADGVDLRQVVPAWWRRQISYVPQEPSFLNGSVQDNLLAANPDLTDADINRVIHDAGLGRFIDESPQGLETQIDANGMSLANGIRRRLALARALTTDGALVIFDEPTEGLDGEGCAAVYGVLRSLAEQGRTIILISHDPVILKGARLILDLNSKPAPTVRNIANEETDTMVTDDAEAAS